MSMRVAEQVAQRLQAFVHSGQWQPGCRIPAERQLAQELGVSRSSLREAVQQLVSQGLLVSRRGDGTYVQAQSQSFLLADTFEPLAQLLSRDPEYSHDVLEARMALEASTAWHAALRATPSDKDRIRRAFDVMVQHQKNGDSALSAKADARFHLAIAEASHNVVLLRVMHSLFEVVLSTVAHNRRAMFTLAAQGSLEELTQQHDGLMQAILDGDAPRARAMIDAHLGYVRETLRRMHDDDARHARYARTPEQIKLPGSHIAGD